MPARVGATASVDCTVTGETFLGWFKGGIKITNSAKIRVESNGPKHTLRFDDVQVSDGSDNYECRGSSNKVKLIVQVACKYEVFMYVVYHLV